MRSLIRRYAMLVLLAGCGSNALLSRDLNASTSPAALAVDWMKLTVDLVRNERLFPPVAARIYAYTAIALYEGIVPGTPNHVSLGGQLNGLGALPAPLPLPHDWLTVANRALRVVVRGMFDVSFRADSTSVAVSRGFIDGVELNWIERRRPLLAADVYDRSVAQGQAVGDAILAWAAGDGFAALHNAAYTPPTGPGFWAPSPPTYARVIEPRWGEMRTFAIPDGSFAPVPPPTPYSEAPASPFFAENLEVYDFGNSLTPEQKVIAQFWSDDPAVTGTPAGHWVSIVSQLVLRDLLPIEIAAEAYARVGIAVADAFIACWWGKFEHNLIRPVNYIRDHIDGDWLPLLGTPPFPEYPSGHSVQSGAAATALTGLFGPISFVDQTHVDRGFAPRTFFSFLDAAEEAAISRLYGGIHYRPAIELGVEQGMSIGDFINANIDFQGIS